MKQLNTTQLRFYKISEAPDFINIFPNGRNEIIGEQYYDSFDVIPYMREHIPGDFSFQFEYSNEDEKQYPIKVYKNGIYASDMTLSPKIGLKYIASIELTEGYYQFVMNDYLSDYLVVETNNKNLIKIEATDIGIRLDTDFTDYSIIAYYSGYIEEIIGTIFIDQFKGDPNTLVNVEVEPSMDLKVILSDIHKTYKERIIYLFSLNNLKINDKIVTLKNEIKEVRKENTDLYDVEILFQIKTDYSYE